jgi:hypothetical protein
LWREWPGNSFNGRPQSLKAHNVFDVAGQQQLLDHVEDEKRQHAVEGNSLPEFGATDEEQSTGLTKKIATVREPRARGYRAGIGRH